MRESRHITRFLSLLLAALLLVLAGSGPVWSVDTAAQPACAQAGKKTEPSPQAVVKAAQFEAVVTTAATFDFSHVVYLLPPVSSVLLTVERPVRRRIAEVPYFYFSYFRHVFGHFIAPNAP